MKNVRVFVNGELRDLKVVRAMKGDALKNRIQAGGGCYQTLRRTGKCAGRNAWGASFYKLEDERASVLLLLIKKTEKIFSEYIILQIIEAVFVTEC